MTIATNLQEIRKRMAAAASRSGRPPEAVKLVAVSKTVEWERCREAAAAGQLVFGENYLQEARAKIPRLEDLGAKWHFIGHLQSNKARAAVELFQMIETVDRLKLAKALEKHAASLNRSLEILIQINIGREEQKSGIRPEDAEALLREVMRLPHLQVKGLMAMPPFFDDPEAARPFFRELRELAGKLAEKGLLGLEGPPELSMGMTGDFEAAVEEGATMVRIGTALFGAR